MKSLRKTIRKILVENQAHYDKLARLICTGELENIKQAIDLAESMGYIHQLEYKHRDGEAFGLAFNQYEDHLWYFYPVKPFEATLMEEFQKQPKNRDFTIKPLRKDQLMIRLERDLIGW